jgi:hypothetical protein
MFTGWRQVLALVALQYPLCVIQFIFLAPLTNQNVVFTFSCFLIGLLLSPVPVGGVAVGRKGGKSYMVRRSLHFKDLNTVQWVPIYYIQ